MKISIISSDLWFIMCVESTFRFQDFFPLFPRDSSQSREEALSVLRSNGEFVRYAVSVAVQKIQQLEETRHTDGPDGQNADRTFRFLCDVTRFEITPFLSLCCCHFGIYSNLYEIRSNFI